MSDFGRGGEEPKGMIFQTSEVGNPVFSRVEGLGGNGFGT